MARTRKVSKEAYNYIVDTLRENGSMSTEEGIELIRPHYDFDPRAAREREIRKYLGHLVRNIRDGQGTRSTFLVKVKSEIVNIDTCRDPAKLRAVEKQLKVQTVGSYRSYRKATNRRRAVEGQIALFDLTNIGL